MCMYVIAAELYENGVQKKNEDIINNDMLQT